MKQFGILFLFLMGTGILFAQSFDNSTKDLLPEGIKSEELAVRTVPDERVRRYILPQRVVWKTETGIVKEKMLFSKPLGQTSTADMGNGFTMEKKGQSSSAILLDFGVEIQGGIRLEGRGNKPGDGSVGQSVRIRVRFGESADEAMSEIGEKGSMTDHSMRDMIVNVPWLGAVEFGESAFRFVRLDLVDKDTCIHFDSIRAVLTYRDLPWIGSFRCSDEELNRIWKTAAYTQHLTMQQYIFEGAKRDRLVWYGDFNPQTMTTLYVFGTPKVLRDTLGYYARTVWPLPKWMNGMPNYSLWWIISVSDLYRYSGNKADLKDQHDYLKNLIKQLIPYVKETGEAAFSNPFLDWPTNANKPALVAGTQAMFVIAFDRTVEMARALGDIELEKEAKRLADLTRKYIPNHVNNKQAASLMLLAGLDDAKSPDIDVVTKNGAEGFSTFYGYYMLEALAKGDKKQVALDVIRQYWGGMLKVGATTFWEDFDLQWLKGAGRIDELTPKGKESLHGDRGAYCYVGFRHSLCHAWASGPAPWLSANILGVRPIEPGFKSMMITPFLGDLDWAEGTIPTPFGPVFVRHEKDVNGKIKTTVKASEKIKIISNE